MAEVNMEQLLNCALCPNMCRSECPVLQVTGREAVAPAGKARIAALINEGKLAWDEVMLEAASNCLGCRGCTIYCPFPELNLCDELLYSRMPAKGGGASLPAIDPYLNNLRKYSSPYGQKTGAVIASSQGREAGWKKGRSQEGNRSREWSRDNEGNLEIESDPEKGGSPEHEQSRKDGADWKSEEQPEDRDNQAGPGGAGDPGESRATLEEPGLLERDILFYNGCTSLANHPASIEAARSVLERAGISFQMIEEDCCGYPAEVWGDEELARQLAEENRSKFAASGASLLVTNCPECWLTFSRRYPARGQELPLEIIDGPTFLLHLVRQGRLQPKETGPGTGEEPEVISYHDPCIWARTAEKTEEPREILQYIPGLKVIEPHASRALTRCCGGGSMFQLAFPATASAVARRRLTEFPPEAPLVTACPFCREGLLQDKKPVWELIELVERFFE